LPVPSTTAPAAIVVDAMELGLPLAAKAYVGDVAPVAVTVNKVPVKPSTLAVAVPDAVAAFVPLTVKPVHPVIAAPS